MVFEEFKDFAAILHAQTQLVKWLVGKTSIKSKKATNAQENQKPTDVTKSFLLCCAGRWS